eukprot:COSAG06_NODE_8850_length_2053_cov_1.638690_1_plen_58_part_10
MAVWRCQMADKRRGVAAGRERALHTGEAAAVVPGHRRVRRYAERVVDAGDAGTGAAAH